MGFLDIRNVTKSYGALEVLHEVDISVEEGEFLVLVGPSGCGKSTLLNMIVGLEQVSSGEIRVDGELVNDLDPRERNMAMVFQSYAIYPHMTVRENMAFPLKLAKLPPEEIERRVGEAAAILELTPLLERRPHALSGGQRQRVAMGRAIVREPSVFLLDEPLSNLDAKLRGQMRMEIARLQRRLGTTTLYVTHDQTEAMTLGDRIAVLRGGNIQQIGTPRELYERPANLFVAGFIGSPAMNFLPARLEEGELVLPLGSLKLAGEGAVAVPPGGELVAAFRPEHLQLAVAGSSAGSLCFEAQVELLEWLGPELFVHFEVGLDGFGGMALPQELGIGSGDAVRTMVVARIDPGCGVKEGETLALCIDPANVQLFDARSGGNLLVDRV